MLEGSLFLQPFSWRGGRKRMKQEYTTIKGRSERAIHPDRERKNTSLSTSSSRVILCPRQQIRGDARAEANHFSLTEQSIMKKGER